MCAFSVLAGFQNIACPTRKSFSDRAVGSLAGGSDCAGATEPENYNDHVARGWESKSVEAQQAEAAEKSSQPRPRMSTHEAAVFRESENLRLARQQVLQQLQTSRNPRHRKLMEDALADLDEKLGRLAK